MTHDGSVGSAEGRHFVFVASHLVPELGIERALLSLVEALRDEGACAEIFLLAGGPEDSVRDPTCRRFGAERRGIARLTTVAAATRALRAARAGGARPIVVCVGAWAAIPMLAVAPASIAANIVVWEHSLIREKVRSSRSLALLQFAARVFYRRAAAVVAVSPPLAADLEASSASARVHCIPNLRPSDSGVVSVPAPADASDGRVKLVSVGSLTRTKNHGVTIAALTRLPARVCLEIFGDGAERDALVALAAASGVADRVTFAGFRPQSEVVEAMAGADVVVHPALGETFGYVYLEAAACGAPVVAVSHRVSEWLIPRYVPGRLCGTTPDELAAAIADELRAKREGADTAAASLERERTFGTQPVTQAWVRLHDAVLERRS